MKIILTSILLAGINGFPAPDYGSGTLMRRQEIAPTQAPTQTQAQAQPGGSDAEVSNRYWGYPYYGYSGYPYYYGYPYYGWPYWRSGANTEGEAQEQPNQPSQPNTF